MKKLLLFTSLFLALSCSKDDEVSADPIIGTWSLNMNVKVEGYPASLVGTITYDANGSYSRELVFTAMGESETDKETDKWSNDASKPDFSSTIQNYTWGEDDKYSAVFSSDFKSVVFEEIEEKDETASSQNSEDDDDEDEDSDPFRIIRLTRK